jgi:hypothetical protein
MSVMKSDVLTGMRTYILLASFYASPLHTRVCLISTSQYLLSIFYVDEIQFSSVPTIGHILGACRCCSQFILESYISLRHECSKWIGRILKWGQIYRIIEC